MINPSTKALLFFLPSRSLDYNAPFFNFHRSNQVINGLLTLLKVVPYDIAYIRLNFQPNRIEWILPISTSSGKSFDTHSRLASTHRDPSKDVLNN